MIAAGLVDDPRDMVGRINRIMETALSGVPRETMASPGVEEAEIVSEDKKE